MSREWAEVSCTVPAAMVDRLAEFLVDLSQTGVTIDNLSLDTFSLDTVADTPNKTVKAYFPADPDLDGNVARIAAFLADTGPDIPGFIYHEPTITLLREEDWANNWKAYFKPSRIGRRLVIKPTWEPFTAEQDDIIIEIDPGMAFGTGTHPTTRLCLEALERIFFRENPYDRGHLLEPAAILDVGTGSGVLAIAAAKLGGRRVVGLDIDPAAVDAARQNLDQNNVGGNVQVSSAPLESIPGRFDIVVANILAEELVRLGEELDTRVGPHGFLILSGILTEKEELVQAGFAPFHLSLVETTRDAEWSCLAYRRED
jgi:ribosomal protein L11 methyltransferase